MEEDRVVPFYITVPDDRRLIRAVKREKQQKTNEYSEVCRRYLADETDFSEEKLKECGITEQFVNDDLTECTQQILNKITKEVSGE